MDTSTFTRHSYHHLMHTLRQNLPPAPPDPAAAAARDYAAIAQVAALCPANAAEAAIAAQAVAANAQAMVTMGQANAPDTDPKHALRCVAQTASMMRQAQGALRMLHAMQAERRKREADHEATDRSAWIEYGAAQWMTEVLPTPQPGPAREASDQNPGHNPTHRDHETNSAEPPGTDSYQNPGHDPIQHSHETETTIPPPPPPAAVARTDAEPPSPRAPDNPVPREPPCAAQSKASPAPLSSPAPLRPTSLASWAPMSARSRTPPIPPEPSFQQRQ